MEISTLLLSTRSQLWRALANRELRLLWLGETVSQFGDQFYLIGLPFLILALTGTSAQYGIALLIEGLPCAVFMFVGGVITDRLSPRCIMLYSNGARLFITVIMAGLIFSQHLQLWMLYVIAFFFGTIDAFFQPAFMTMLPRLVETDQLQVANSLIQSSNQTIQAVGPGLAGVVIGGLGIGSAILLDAITFLFTTIALLSMPPTDHSQLKSVTAEERKSARSVLADIMFMIRYVARHNVLRPYMLLILVINLLLVGPGTVGVLALAQARFLGSPSALGLLLSAIGLGAVLGSLASGIVKMRRFGMLFLGTVGGSGLCLALLGVVTSLWSAMSLFGAIGFLLGFSNVLLLTWFGKQIPPTMLGRFMSLYVLLGVGLAPLSNALAGLTLSVSVTGTFLVAGLLLLLACGAAAFNPILRGLAL